MISFFLLLDHCFNEEKKKGYEENFVLKRRKMHGQKPPSQENCRQCYSSKNKLVANIVEVNLGSKL